MRLVSCFLCDFEVDALELVLKMGGEDLLRDTGD
jgi:hypothetical protein